MVSPFDGLEIAARSERIPMAVVTSFHIGGPAEHFIEPRSFEELARLASRCCCCGVPFRILGGGSNILVSDRGVSGAVFRLSGMKGISRSGSRMICEAGSLLHRIVLKAQDWGLGGLEPLAGIPGTVGGAVAMNAGGKYGAVAALLHSVTTLDKLGFIHERSRHELNPGYRHMELHEEVVLRAVFDLAEEDPVKIAEKRLTVLEDKSKTQPLCAFSAGCIFKNPAGRMSAGQMIDQAGLKGRRVGQAVVSAKHANFIINEGGASAQDVLELIGNIRERVRKVFGTDLELEIELWN